jgi:mannose-6-phosphate isomerase class I
MRQLKPIVKTYDWGMPTQDSIASLFVKDETTYDKIAELWWGHPSVIVRDTLETIDITYLFKLLFVDKPLSLQAHPTMEQILEYPVFPDAMQKPEIIIALTQFEALSGFLSVDQIIQRILKIPPLYPYKNFQMLFSVSDIDALIGAVREYALNFSSTDVSCRIFLSLLELYPSGDPAVFCPFYMNYVSLEAGQALIIPASHPHCYLSGQGVECMPPSDNVVRCGLTTKPRDITLFFNIAGSSRQDALVQEYPYSHPQLDAFFHLLEPDENGECVCKDKSVVLVLEGSGTIDVENTSQGDSWIVESDSTLSFSTGLKVIVAVPI